jgi:hypothetical protein
MTAAIAGATAAAASPRPSEDPADLRPFGGGGRAPVIALGAGGLGAALLACGFLIDARQAIFSYLIAFAYLLSASLGALAFVMAAHAMDAKWPVAVRRLAEAVAAPLPLFALLFVPVAAGARHLYPWMHPESVSRPEARALLAHKLAYLNLPFVAARAAIYFAFFTGVSGALRRWSRSLDRPGPHAAAVKRRMRVLSSLALPGLGVFGTMAAWDWIMSLSADWYSTMFGLYFLAGGFVTALAVISLLTVLAKRGGFLPRVGGSHYYALGRLMFAFLIFWAYTSYWQYFLSWIADLPIEAEWFVKRSVGGYGTVGLFLVFGHFALPFFILLSYWIKRRAWGIAAVAAWIVGAHYFDVHWMIAAARERPNPFSWMDAAALVGLGGLVTAFALWRQRGLLVAPVYDPSFLTALEYKSK